MIKTYLIGGTPSKNHLLSCYLRYVVAGFFFFFHIVCCYFFSLLFYYIDFIFLRTFTTSGWHDKNNKGICAHKLWYCCKTWSKWLQTIQMELMHFYHERGKICDINSQCGQLNALTFLTCESNGRENFYLLQFDFLFMRDKTKQDKRIWHFSWPIIRQLWGSVYNNTERVRDGVSVSHSLAISLTTVVHF